MPFLAANRGKGLMAKAGTIQPLWSHQQRIHRAALQLGIDLSPLANG
jgi:hypothetical protein